LPFVVDEPESDENRASDAPQRNKQAKKHCKAGQRMLLPDNNFPKRLG
jgi:hypothetical protein